MRFNEQINLKLYTYTNGAFTLQAIIDDYQEISFVHNLYEAGDFTITINYNIPNALKFERGMWVQFGNDNYMFGEIQSITDSIGEDGKGSQVRTIAGKDARFIFKRRIIKNLNNEENWAMTDKGEICLRELVKAQCGSGSEEKRQLPISNTIPVSSSAIGKEYSVAEAFSNLYDTLVTIATQSEIGWRIKFDGALTLEVFEGSDLSSQVQFSTDFDSLSNGEFTDSAESYANTIYVGGKGTGADRDIYEGESAIEGESPAGLDRYEAWDNQSSMTSESEYEAEAFSMLTQYGQTLNINGQGLAKCPYEFQKQYNIGDTITLAFSGKSAKAQILSVTEHWVWGQYGIEFSFGKPQNDLSRQLQLILKQIQKASNKTTTTSSVKYYTIPGDTSQPKADVIYDTIGFQGNVGSGATFTLYYDSEKTGAKTYHVWFNQLAGSGKLTLTTGVSGASNLILNPGTYVAIIYVDANGNVLSQGATATDVIQTGSTQPATSGAVADEIENVTEIASSLPTDAVLHYSFDEVPDYPDGTAFNFYNNNFVVGDWLTNQATLSVTDGKMKVAGNANYIYALIRQSTYTLANLLGKIVKAKIFVHSANTASNSNFRTVGNDTSGNVIIAKEKYDQWIEVTFAINAGTPSNQWLGVVFPTASADNYWQIEILYIGNGSYSTPIIDNANGQHNSVSQSGIVADKGVGGKSVRFMGVNSKLIQVNTPKELWENAYSVSCWIRKNNSNIYVVGCLIYQQQVHYIRYSDTAKNLYFYVHEATRDIGYRFNVELENAKWYHLVCINKAINGQSEIWLNGIKQTLSEITLTVTTRDGIILLGTTYQGNNNFDTNTNGSQLDDFIIFDRVLTEQEILALYQNKANTPKYYDLSDYKLKEVKDNAQPQILATPITIAGQSYTTVESALQALAGAV